MPKKKHSRKLFSQPPKLPTAPNLGSDATPSAANAPPHPTPNRPEFGNLGYIEASNKQNCKKISVTDNRADNSVGDAVTHINPNYLSGYNERGNEPSHKAHFMVPYPRNGGFIGISQTLAWLEEKMKGGGANHHRVALLGMGGVGKTQDVLECIYHYQSSQQLSVFWVDAGSQLRFERDYRKLAGLAGLLVSDDIRQDIRPVVKSWLEGPESGNWILVLDSVDNKLDFKSAYPDIEATGDNGLVDFIPHGSKGAVIITTRDHEIADQLVSPCNILDKTAMDSIQARQLFTQNYPKATEYTDNEDKSISLLLEALQYLPLAVAQVSAYLHQNTLLLPSEYINLFRATKDGQKELLSKPFSDIHREYQFETVWTTFSISLRQLQEQSPLASSLLQLMACIDNQRIPYELLASSLEEDDQEFPLVEALSKLIAFGFISTSRQGEREEEKDYEMHSLVHISINSFISTEEKDTAVKQMVKTFRRIYPKILSKSYDTNTYILYLSHASALVNYMKGACHSEDRPFIYSTMSLLFLSIGNTPAAEEKAKQAAKLGTDILGLDHPDTLTAIGNLASTYKNQGRLKEAEELGVQVMGARKRVLGPEHPDTLAAISNLATTYWSQGRLKEAEELGIQVMKVRKRTLGPEHPDTLAVIGNLASTYKNQGRLKEAEELGMQVTEARKRVLGPEHPDTLTAISNLASTYQKQGHLKEAEELGIQVMEARKRVFGPEHPDTLMSIGNLAATYWSQGRLKETEELGIQVMEVRKRVLGPEHPDTLVAISNLAATYWSQGRLKEAEELRIQVMKVRKRVLGPEHPDTLMSIGNIASTYKNQGRLKEAEELEMQVMEAWKRVLGPEHPDTLTAIGNLALTYWKQGHLEKAEELGIQVMEARKRVLGPEHPDTLAAIGNLTSIYWNQGRLGEAEDLGIQVMEARKRVLGPEHPDTLTAISNLALTYWNQGHLKKAEELGIQVLDAQKRALGPEHPDTLLSISNLASTYQKQGRLKEATELGVQVMEARKRVLGPEHPDTLIAINNLVSIYKQQGRLKEAGELAVQVMKARKRANARPIP